METNSIVGIDFYWFLAARLRGGGGARGGVLLNSTTNMKAGGLLMVWLKGVLPLRISSKMYSSWHSCHFLLRKYFYSRSFLSIRLTRCVAGGHIQLCTNQKRWKEWNRWKRWNVSIQICEKRWKCEKVKRWKIFSKTSWKNAGTQWFRFFI